MINHRNPKDKEKAISWAKNILDKKENYVILDTETSGIGKNDVVLEIAVIDLEGNTLFDSRIRPTKRKRASEIATNINGIKISDLKDFPTFSEVKGTIEKVIGDKNVIIYNSEFDERLINQTCEQDGCNYLKIKTSCAMIPYSQFVGTWSDHKSDYKFQKLPNSNHTALGDSLATLKVIQRMASYKFKTAKGQEVTTGKMVKSNSEINVKKKWWEFWK